MKTTVLLESKDVRVMIASFLDIRMEDVIPNRYNFSVQSMKESEIEEKVKSAEEKLGRDK